MKKISVIIPVYGAEKYVAATVQSLLDQTYENFEALIIDDGSPDRSLEICQQFTDPRIKIIRQKNRGLAGARNTGIRHAQGDYIAFLDADDLWLPEKLAKHIEHLENSPDVGVSFSPSELIDESGSSLGTYLMPQLKEITVPDLFRHNPVGNGSAAVVRREVFEDIKFQDELYGTVEYFYFYDRLRRNEDIEFWLRVAIQTDWKIEGISEYLTLYRVNSGGLSANFFKQLESWEQVLEKTHSYAPELVAQWGSLSRAYQLRYLARNALRLHAGSEAVQLIHQALAADGRILLKEPSRTLSILAVAHTLRLLPKPLYLYIEALASKWIGGFQRQRFLQKQAEQLN